MTPLRCSTRARSPVAAADLFVGGVPAEPHQCRHSRLACRCQASGLPRRPARHKAPGLARADISRFALPLLRPLSRPGGQAAKSRLRPNVDGVRGGLVSPPGILSECGWVPDPLVPLVAAQRRRHSCCMPLSRTQPMPDLFGAVADDEPDHGPARLTSIRPTPVVMSTAAKSSSRYVLPGDLSSALRQLDDFELDRLVETSRYELQRRGRPMTPAPKIRRTTHISPGERTSKPSIAKDPLSERQQLPELKGTLTQGQVNAVLATFKAGIAPSRIAKQFGISQSDVRKVLASEPRRSGKGR